MLSLKATCRSAFEGAQANPSASQQQMSKTLRDMGLSVEDEVRCQKSGNTIDMLGHAHDSAVETGGERSSGRVWAVDGPSHFLASGAPTGATLLKRRHLELLGHALVSVPYWEWSGCKGAGEREQYVKSKLAECGPRAAKGEREREREGGREGGRERMRERQRTVCALSSGIVAMGACAARVAAEEEASKLGAPESPVRCPVCSKEFELRIALSNHLRDKHDVEHQQFRSDPGSCEARGQEQEAAGAVKFVGIKKAGGASAHCRRTAERRARRAAARRATAAAGASAAHGTAEGNG
jgi:hypothetical protein